MPGIGQTISHFRLMEKIGQGGMGEIYLADDLLLDRKVALKFLPEAFTSDPERMARFEREAKLLASLNHSNFAGIYGLKPFPIANSEYNEAQGTVSPDGGWIAFSSDQSGQSDIYVQMFPSPGQRQKVTENGGTDPKWSIDGKELFYIASDGKLMAAPCKRSDGLDFESPVPLFDTKIFNYNRESISYDVSNDGRRFVLPKPPSDLSTHFSVIFNWTSLLEK